MKIKQLYELMKLTSVLIIVLALLWWFSGSSYGWCSPDEAIKLNNFHRARQEETIPAFFGSSNGKYCHIFDSREFDYHRLIRRDEYVQNNN